MNYDSEETYYSLAEHFQSMFKKLKLIRNMNKVVSMKVCIGITQGLFFVVSVRLNSNQWTTLNENGGITFQLLGMICEDQNQREFVLYSRNMT